MIEKVTNLPPQRLSFKAKNKSWRKKHMDWANSKSFFNYSPIRKSVQHKKINIDLVNGKLHMQDMELILNPEGIHAGYIPNKIQHYPIINTKLEVLKGEERARLFDYRAIVTNPNAISEIENNKKQAVLERLQQWIQTNHKSDEEAQAELDKISDFFTYEWQDMKELAANQLLNHYNKELNFADIFNDGFMDAATVSEEIYQCDIVGGEPTLVKLNPCKVRVFRSGYSNKIEDADMIILEDYWSPGRVIDTYYDVLSEADRKYIETLPDHVGQASVDSMDQVDERLAFVNHNMIGDEITSQEGFFWDPLGMSEGISNSMIPYDTQGNLRVLRLYWKSQRKVKKVKSYDPETGEEVLQFYPETYICDKNAGEEETIYWVNEAWEGTLIGDSIYVNMRPRPVQYNRLSNPSRCHFGIVGSIYNIDDCRPYSLVDRMKPLAYLYDAMHDRLNKILARNWGNMVQLDFAKKPKGWDVEKWMYYAKSMGLLVVDSFNEGTQGAAKGKLAGGLNNNAAGVVNASDTQSIQYYTMMLDYIKMELSDMVGITKQREGQVANRETVGGVERATLQSSHITEWLFAKHDDVKRRVLECFLETAKAAFKGSNKKFQYILSDGAQKTIDITGDDFADADYGICISSDENMQKLNSSLDTLAQAAIQNDKMSFSTLMKLYSSASIAEKQRFIEHDEQKARESAAQAQQQEMQMHQAELEQKAAAVEKQYNFQDMINQRDNETKILVAQINGEAEAQRFAMMNDDDTTFTEKDKAELAEKIREFDASMKMNEKQLEFQKQKANTDAELKRKQIAKQAAKSASSK